MYRLFAIGVLLLWVSAMAALFARDIWPAWTAQDPPPMTRGQLASLDGRTLQFGLYGSDEERIGTAWSTVVVATDSIAVRGTVVLEGWALLLPLRIETVTEFDAGGGLDSFSLNVFGVPDTKIHIAGERRGIYFPCELHVGPLHREANLDLSASRMIGESLRPFAFLPTLQVGQAWRMQLLDPVSAAISGKTEFRSVVARVTGREVIEHPRYSGRLVESFVVETFPGHGKAWVGPDGRVLVQQADMPGLGRITVREEPLEETRHNVVTRRSRSGGDGGAGAACDTPDESSANETDSLPPEP